MSFISKSGHGRVWLVGPYGFRSLVGVGVGGLQQRRLEYALINYQTLKRLKPDERVVAARNINFFPTEAELEAEDRLVAIRTLPDGTTHEGTLAEYREAVQNNRMNNILEQLDAIANS